MSNLLPENEKRKRQLVRDYLERSCEEGDYYWTRAAKLQGTSDHAIEEAVIAYHMRNIKVKDDYHFRMADALTGAADYVYGQDEGEEPRYN